jgi:LacI family repressor for deo operon, udp, cdd, tsx, nupC, and nupG
VRSLLSRDDPPDGLFCFSDELAAGVLRELHEQRLHAPSDISVVGFDDIQKHGSPRHRSPLSGRTKPKSPK